MNQNRKSILARLLATENVEVVFGKFDTASFSPSSRILNLPIWTDSSNDLADLMVGHEVGHALYTPADGWHDAVRQTVYPRSYANIIEDIRIERMVQDKYPGLKGSFKRGYKVLMDRNFFGLEGKDINKKGFMDRLNVKSKLRDLISVDFSAEELPFVKMAMTTETFQDVDATCIAIHAFLKEKKEQKDREKMEELAAPAEEPQQPDVGPQNDEEPERSDEEPESSDEEPESSDEDITSESSVSEGDGEVDDKDSTESVESDDGESESASGEDGESAEGDDESESDDIVAAEGDGAGEGLSEETETEVDPLGDGEEDQGFTEDIFRKSQKTLLNKDVYENNSAIIDARTPKQAAAIVVGYPTIAAAQKKYSVYSHYEREFDKFVHQTNNTAGVMAREFEIRKAAYQQARTKTSRSGVIDVTKLHNYKFTDDIFLRNDTIGNAKSHGMVMLIDFSASMVKVVNNVIDQTIVLATFCQKVGIPFEVYSFTSGREYNSRSTVDDNCLIDAKSLLMVERLNSSMKRATFKDAVRRLYMARRSHELQASQYNHLGNTPTIEALDVTRGIIHAFQTKHNVQKTHFVMISDGEPAHVVANRPNGYRARGNDIIYRTAPNKMHKFGGGKYNGNTPADHQDIIIKALGEEKGISTHCFYIIPYMSVINKRLHHIIRKNVTSKEKSDITSKVRNDKFVSLSDIRGFHNFMIMRGDVDAVDDNFDVSDDASVSDVRRAFKKFAGSKRGNRAMAAKFGALVAV